MGAVAKMRAIILCILFVFSTVSFAERLGQEADSIRNSLNLSTTERAKLAVLQRMFRRYKDTDFDRAAFYSTWMYEAFKNSKDSQVLRTVHFLKGESLLNVERYDSAIVFYTQALKYSDELGKAQCFYRLGKANDRLGKQALALGQLQTANAYFADVKSYKNIHGTYDLMIAIYARNGDYDSAIKLIKKKLELDRSRNSVVKEMEDHISVASLYGQQNKFNLAFEHLSNALDIAERTKSGFAEIYRSIGNLFFQKRNTSIALMYYKKALEQFATRESDDVLADTYNNLGRVYLEQGRMTEAQQHLTKALQLAKTRGYRHQLADAYRIMGQYYKKSERFDLAMKHLQQCYQTGCNQCSRLAFFDVMVEIADLYEQQGKRDLSKEWFVKSLRLAENFSSKREMSVAKQRLGSLALSQKEATVAERYFLQSMQDAQESKQPSTVKDIADMLGSFYERQGDFKKAYHYVTWSKMLGDSISRMDGKANMAALEMNFEFERLKKANEARQVLSLEEIKRQKQFRNFLFIIVALLMVMGAFILYSYRKKMIDNRMLIFQKKQIEEKNKAILEQVEEIRSQKDEIERISAKLHETDGMKLRFFSNISHEIRTPLTLIINPLKSILHSFQGEDEQKRQLQLVYDNTVRLHELTNQILDLQKLDSGKLELHRSQADVVAHLKGLVALFEGFSNDRNSGLVFHSQHTSVICGFDADKVSKICSNVLSNALKYNRDGGEVMLSLLFGENQLSIVVEDEGSGIPQANLNTIFNRYYQLDASNTQYEGTGIGLAYVKELTELMEGKIDVSSTVGSGTKLVITLPVEAMQVVQSEESHTEFRAKQLPPFVKLPDLEQEDVSAQTILIVEDNVELRNLIGRIFDADYHVVYAQNGEEGMEKALQYIPDLVISDVMMPQMNGLELCEAIKKNEQTCHIPILLLTAKDSHDNHLLGYQSGADDYMVKPFDSEILKLKVQNRMETQEAMKKQFSLDNVSEKSNSSYNPLDKAFLKNCVALIKDHLDDPDFSVDALMEKTAFGRRSLFRKMKALTNMSPYEFITAYRLKQAASLLKKGQRVSEVAYSVGFSNPQSFSIAFKKQFGVPPSEFKG